MTTATTTLSDEAKTLRELRGIEAAHKEAYDEAKMQRERHESDLIERMDAEECESLKVDGTNFVPAHTTYAQIQDRAEFVAWAEANDEQLLETKERKQVLNQLVRERHDNGEALPPGVGFYVKEYVSLRAN